MFGFLNLLTPDDRAELVGNILLLIVIAIPTAVVNAGRIRRRITRTWRILRKGTSATRIIVGRAGIRWERDTSGRPISTGATRERPERRRARTMCNYRLTVTIGKSTDIVDGGGWATGMTWRKTVILEESERADAIALRDLFNGGGPASDDLGYLMWDRCYGMCNPQCWQWELVCRHSACVNQILRKAGIDWPEDGLPDIDLPTITINLAIC